MLGARARGWRGRFACCGVWNTAQLDRFTRGKGGRIIAIVGLRGPEQPGWTRKWFARTAHPAEDLGGTMRYASVARGHAADLRRTILKRV
jgi:hypothetical protein